MAELRLRLVSPTVHDDLVTRFGAHATVGQLADELEQRFGQAGGAVRTLQRRSRGEATLSRDSRLGQVDLRSGDEIRLIIDSGVRPVPSTAALAHLRVVEGPDRGRVFELRRGESTIGRSPRCDVTIHDDLASRRHALVRISDIIEVADAGSTNGIVINGSEVSGVHRLRSGDQLQVGDTVLEVDLLSARHEAVDLIDNAVAFNRPPRIDRPFQAVQVTIPAPVPPLPRARLPLITAIAPLLMGAIFYYLTRHVTSLVFIGLSPVMAVGSVLESRRSGRKELAVRQAERQAELADRIDELDAARVAEVASRLRFAPAVDELAGVVSDLSSRLWEREPEDPDFLSLRVGLGPLPSSVEIATSGPVANRDARQEIDDLIARYAELPPVPVTIDARGEAPVGVAGPLPVAEAVARSLVLQAAVLHSPDELLIGALVSAEQSQTWEWLKWLPHHVRPLPSSDRTPGAVGADEGIELLMVLQELIRSRSGEGGPGRGRGGNGPHVLLVVDGSVGIERTRFATVLEDGATAGVSLLWVTTDARRVPNACRTLVTVEPGDATLTVGRRSSGEQIGGIAAEPLTGEAAERLARALAPVVDISAGGTTEVVLPAVANLVDLLGGPEVLDSPAATIERWGESAPRPGRRGGAGTGIRLGAPIGVYAGGTLNIDLREDGPHGLVGGTTGSGKSELLQAYLAALAATHSPDRLNFLLIDYKGGSAFGDLADRFDRDGNLIGRGLHHSVGMITDLTPALAQRALISLQAELTRREHLLDRHGVKDLAEMIRQRLPDPPPSLVIVIDEFAVLAQEAPAFVDGVVDIARRGRSYGLHLLLATQKPGGVVTPAIQANTTLRVALRMASEDDSNDVIRSPLAGRLDRRTPGRGVVRRGHSDLVLFQSAYVGGVTTPESMAQLEVGEWSLAGIHWPEPVEATTDADQETDLRRLVRVMNAAADQLALKPPRRPWLDPLPWPIDLRSIDGPVDDSRYPIGVADEPHRQSRSLACFEPDAMGSMLLYGTGASGKTVALRTLAASLGLAGNLAPVHVYALDFAGRGMEMIEPLPHVGSVIPGDDYERVTRLFKDLRVEIARRAEVFAAAPASSLGEYRRVSPDGPSLARIVVLLDGYDGFLAAFENVDQGQWRELMPRLVSDGRGVGVHFVLTGSRRSSFPMDLTSMVSTRLVFRLAGPEDYYAVGAAPDWFDASTPAGRCRLGGQEIQLATLGDGLSAVTEAAAFRQLGDALARYLPPAPPVRVLPTEVHLSDLPPAKSGLPWLVTDDFQATGPDLSQNVLITGRPRSGKSTALRSLLAAARADGLRPDLFAADPVWWGGAAGSLEGLVARVTANRSGLVFVDGLERLSAVSGGSAVTDAVTAGTLRLVATTDPAFARSYDQFMKTLRARADMVVLQPDDGDSDLVGQPLRRTARRFPPGRGYARLLDRVAVVQVALPDDLA